MSERIDRFGLIASGLCTVHCAMTAIIPALLSALGLGLLISHELEWLFTLIAIGVAIYAMAHSWREVRSVTVITLCTLGVLGLLASRFIEESSAGHGDHGHHQSEVHNAADHITLTAKQDHKPASFGEINVGAELKSGHHAHSKEQTHDAALIWAVLLSILSGLSLITGHSLNIRLLRLKQS